MQDDIFYAIRFENGMYYTASGYTATDIQESAEIEKAALYKFDWQIMKDHYFNAYKFNRNRTYNVVKVKITKTYEILEN